MFLFLQCVVDDNGEPTDELNQEALEFCQQHGVKATKVSEITANKEPAIYSAIQAGIERVNARSTSNAQKVQKWVIVERDFSVTGGELGQLSEIYFPFPTSLVDVVLAFKIRKYLLLFFFFNLLLIIFNQGQCFVIGVTAKQHFRVVFSAVI